MKTTTKTPLHKLIQLLLPTAVAALLATAQAAEPLAVDAVFDQAETLAGQEITVRGAVERVSAARHMVMLVDKAELTCTTGCEPRRLPLQLQETAELPAKGDLIQATGTLEKTEAAQQVKVLTWEKIETPKN